MRLSKILTAIVLVIIMSVSVLSCSVTGGSTSQRQSENKESSTVYESLENETVSETTSSESFSETTSKEEQFFELTTYGSEQRPLTVAEAITLMKPWADNGVSDEQGYVKGVISSEPTYYEKHDNYSFNLQSSTDLFKVYSVKLNGFSTPKVGDTVVIKGYYVKYVKSGAVTYEIAYVNAEQSPIGEECSPVIISVITSGGDESSSESIKESTSEYQSTSDLGTLNNPLTVVQAISLMRSWDDNKVSDEEGYVQGVVVGEVYHNTKFDSYNIYLDAGSETFELYSVQLNGFNAPNVGDTVTARGYFKKFVKDSSITYEVAYISSLSASPVIVAVNGNSEHESSSEYETSTESESYSYSFDGEVFTFTCDTGSYYSTIMTAYTQGFTANQYQLKTTYGKNALKLELRTIINKTKHNTSYDDLKSTTKGLPYSDASLKNSGKMVLFYSHKEVNAKWDGAATWNREHVWPKSKGWFTNGGAGADIHHIRPEDPKDNGSRGNTSFGESSSYFYPVTNGVDARGDVARILFYMATRYEQTDTSYPLTKVAQSVAMLVKWNKEDPVDALEKQRNERAYEVQGNRNPFIDCPDLATYIFG